MSKQLMFRVSYLLSHLTTLDFSNCQPLSKEFLASTFILCANLKKLNLHNAMPEKGFITELAHCPHLTSLNFSYCTNISDIDVLQLTETCSGIKRLSLA